MTVTAGVLAALREEAKKSDCCSRHAAALLTGNRRITCGHNRYTGLGGGGGGAARERGCSVHAEVAALAALRGAVSQRVLRRSPKGAQCKEAKEKDEEVYPCCCPRRPRNGCLRGV